MTITDNSPRFPGGYFSYDGKPYYYITDYQGNNAKVVDANGGVRQTNNYYPYGEPWSEWSWKLAAITTMCRNRHLFGDKERQPENGINEYDFTARQYVASQMRFTSPDPLAEKRPGLSPYIYCNSNPVMLIDPSGKQTIRPTENTANPLSLPVFPDNTFDWTQCLGNDKTDWLGIDQGESGISLQFDASKDGKSVLDRSADGANNAAAMFGIANGAKDLIIEYAVGSNSTGALGKYVKISQRASGIGGAINAAYAVYNMRNYLLNGGNDTWVIAKYTGDFIAGWAAFAAGMTAIGVGPVGLIIFGAATVYYILDVTTHGFGLDYSPKNK